MEFPLLSGVDIFNSSQSSYIPELQRSQSEKFLDGALGRMNAPKRFRFIERISISACGAHRRYHHNISSTRLLSPVCAQTSFVMNFGSHQLRGACLSPRSTSFNVAECLLIPVAPQAQSLLNNQLNNQLNNLKSHGINENLALD